jgi:hypothetical protein
MHVTHVVILLGCLLTACTIVFVVIVVHLDKRADRRRASEAETILKSLYDPRGNWPGWRQKGPPSTRVDDR